MGQIHDTLRPHRPLDPGESGYIFRPDGAQRILQALTVAPLVGVVGPVGVGKSTELAEVVNQLRTAGRVAIDVPLDRHASMRTLTVDGLHIEPMSAIHGVRVENAGRNGLLISLRAVGGRPALVVDGLEKVADPIRGHELLDALGEFASEADVVSVLPWYSAYGPTAGRVLGEQERIVALRAIDIVQQPTFFPCLFEARDFLSSLDLESADPARWSGGVPRTFLQLVADSLVYGGFPAGIERAVRDQQESVRRALLPGDAKAIRDASGTDGREIELDRRIRLLASGLLLEREKNGIVVEPHPLLSGLLG